MQVRKKNLGPAGITLVIIRDDLIGNARKETPSIWELCNST
ncbi:3-phosphoserine/phosphohydroxythreonine aminotransferase [Haemophilus influenzae]|uniref:3-phosphoserine/phosphohydroxythreonine aminotransferase n=1 Tax=Haemophilus influenzae TaxID=727 RepID=A0A2X1PPH0_HAEIF|nr:3-phosphoserine/phosphohydroxythreonine aminotransferase [Haemophilus influenzae]